MRFLITGGTGFVGRVLARQVAARGDAMTVLVRNRARAQELSDLGARMVEGDLSTNTGVAEALEDVDCVLHLAAAVKAFTPAGYSAVNVTGTRLLSEAAAARPRPPRFVLCSSLAAAGPSQPGQPHTEDAAATPISAYGRSKFGGEKALRQISDRLSAAIVRPPIVYGPGDTELMPRLRDMVRMRVQITVGSGPKIYSLVHVDDLCRGLLEVADHGAELTSGTPEPGLYYVSDGVEYHQEELAAEMARLMRMPTPVRMPVPVWAAKPLVAANVMRGRIRKEPAFINLDKLREARCRAWTCSPRRIERELGFTTSLTPAVGFANYLAALPLS